GAAGEVSQGGDRADARRGGAERRQERPLGDPRRPEEGPGRAPRLGRLTSGATTKARHVPSAGPSFFRASPPGLEPGPQTSEVWMLPPHPEDEKPSKTPVGIEPT